MDWRGAVERRKFFQVRAERFGGRVKICNLMSAAALSCPPFNTQCKKSKNKKKPRNEIQLANPTSDVLCYTLLSMKWRKIKDQIRRLMCYMVSSQFSSLACLDFIRGNALFFYGRTGWYFYCSALKMTNCQTLKKFWHLELFDGIYYVILH